MTNNKFDCCNDFAQKLKLTNGWANKNLVGVFKRSELNLILELIKNLKISYETDKVPFDEYDWLTRVFVIGCDIKKVNSVLKKNHLSC